MPQSIFNNGEERMEKALVALKKRFKFSANRPS